MLRVDHQAGRRCGVPALFRVLRFFRFCSPLLELALILGLAVSSSPAHPPGPISWKPPGCPPPRGEPCPEPSVHVSSAGVRPHAQLLPGSICTLPDQRKMFVRPVDLGALRLEGAFLAPGGSSCFKWWFSPDWKAPRARNLLETGCCGLYCEQPALTRESQCRWKWR